MKQNRSLTNGIGLLLAAILLNTGWLRGDETKEPPVKYRLEVEGKAYPLIEGEPIKLTGTLTNPTVKLVAEPYREFNYGGVSFQYPRAFAFEADVKDGDYKNWTLSGNDLKIMYFIMNEDLTSEAYADEMIKQFGARNSKKSPITSDLLGGKKEGTRVEVTLAGIKLSMDILCLPFQGGTRVLVIQDSAKGAPQSQEAKEALPVLKRTWAVK